jgi:hypothetical protein
LKPFALDLSERTEIDHHADPEVAEHGDVARGEPMERVGPKEQAPAKATPVVVRIAAEIADVLAGLQDDASRHARRDARLH